MRPLFFALFVAGCTTAAHASHPTQTPPAAVEVPDGTASVLLVSPVDIQASGDAWQLSFHQRAQACVNIPAGTSHITIAAPSRWSVSFSPNTCPEEETGDNTSAGLVGFLVGLAL